ncbi:hypothetical protein RN001_009162 [Aquatica leii]|uniref:Uncharacterized protein n=1 Tax=Aquatica leii TaxID=1421715 RepID=A0AAN7P790_9COLE|nr:hypothetical protein RN001_009162 [Aquatica leii]
MNELKKRLLKANQQRFQFLDVTDCDIQDKYFLRFPNFHALKIGRKSLIFTHKQVSIEFRRIRTLIFHI